MNRILINRLPTKKFVSQQIKKQSLHCHCANTIMLHRPQNRLLNALMNFCMGNEKTLAVLIRALAWGLATRGYCSGRLNGKINYWLCELFVMVWQWFDAGGNFWEMSWKKYKTGGPSWGIKIQQVSLFLEFIFYRKKSFSHISTHRTAKLLASKFLLNASDPRNELQQAATLTSQHSLKWEN